MKKIIFSTMIASILAFVGCQNEELVNDNVTDNSGKKVILTANIQGAADSRVALTPETENGDSIVKVEWKSSGEEFKVYNADFSVFGEFTQLENNYFGGTLPTGATGAYYGNYTVSGSTISYDLSEQDGTLNEASVLMKASLTSTSSEITFQHQTAILKPTFLLNSADTITKIVMEGANAGSGKNSITVTPSELDDIYIFLPIETSYAANSTFTFSVTAGGNEYTGTLTIPTSMSIQAGKFYTASIALRKPTTCNLPIGVNFNRALEDFVFLYGDNSNVRAITFVSGRSAAEMNSANSFNGRNNMPSDVKYRVTTINGTRTLEILTDKDVFMFNKDCEAMFRDNRNIPLEKVTSIDLNDCIIDSNPTNMGSMFYECSELTSIDLSNFHIKNSGGLNMQYMFGLCHKLHTVTFGEVFSAESCKLDDMFTKRTSVTDLLTVDLTKLSTYEGSGLDKFISFIATNHLINTYVTVKVRQDGYDYAKTNVTKEQLAVLRKPDGTPWEEQPQ